MCFTFCPRCRLRTLEYLKTHAYCIECGYSPDCDEDDDIDVDLDGTLAAMARDLQRAEAPRQEEPAISTVDATS